MHEGFNYTCSICGKFYEIGKKCSYINQWWHIPILGAIVSAIGNFKDNVCT